MTGLPAPQPGRLAGPAVPGARAAGIVGPAAAAMAAGMGVGRFVYTPILPLMTGGAGLSPQWGAAIATANYAGYLAGAMAGVAVPGLLRSRAVYRSSLIVVVGTLALMPVLASDAGWAALRFVAGCASALVFMVAASALLTGLRARGQHLVGHGFGGVGAGIAASGVLVLVLRHGTWQDSWWWAAVLGTVLIAAAWPLRPSATDDDGTDRGAGPAGRRWFTSLLLAYTLEGVGYIIAGTFLVAAIDQAASTTLGSSAWIIVGVAAVPSAALWAGLSRLWSRPTLLTVALGVQAVGIALPALVGGTTPALASAVLFGATFLGVATLALAAGAHLRGPRAVAILTTGYSAGQIAGPILVTPTLHHRYQPALLAGAVIVAVAAVAALVLRHRFPPGRGPVNPAGGFTGSTRRPERDRDSRTYQATGGGLMPAITVGQENSSDIEIHYEDHGAGQPVVLIHGYPLSGRAWDKQVPALLEAGYRVITYDRRGFGQSSQPVTGYDYDTFAADLATLLDHLDLHDAVLVGHSMGTGEVTRYLSTRGSARVAKGVLVAPIPPFLLQTADNIEGVPQALFDGFVQAAQADTPAWMKGFLDNFYNVDTLRGTLISDQAWQASWNLAVSASATAAVACIGTWVTDFRTDLAEIDVPILVIQGDADQVLPLDKTGKRLPALIKDVRLVVIEGGPHAIPWTHAGQVNTALLDFIRG